MDVSTLRRQHYTALRQKLNRAGLKTEASAVAKVLFKLFWSNNQVHVTKNLMEQLLGVKFKERATGGKVKALEDFQYTEFRNRLISTEIISAIPDDLYGNLTIWTPGPVVVNGIDRAKKGTSVTATTADLDNYATKAHTDALTREVEKLKDENRNLNTKLDKILEWCDSDPVTDDKRQLKQTLLKSSQEEE